MCKNKAIQVRITKSQYERIQNRKEAMGYLRLSNFIRDLLLKDDLASYNLLREIHQRIVGKDNGKNSFLPRQNS